MKKLLSLLGALTMIASTTATVIACGDTELKVNQAEMSGVLEEIGKAVYLNKTKGYNMDYVLQEYSFKNETIKTNYSKYFKDKLIGDSATLSGFANVVGKQPSDSDEITAILAITAKLLGLDASGDKKAQVTNAIKEALEMYNVNLQTGVTAEAKAEMQSVGAILKNVGTALETNSYIGKSYASAINEAMVKLVNEINKVAGVNTSFTATQFAQAMTSLTSTIKKLSTAGTGFDFAALFATAESSKAFIDVLKLTLLYINHIFTLDLSKDLENDDFIKAREAVIASTTFDLKGVVIKLNDALFGASQDSTGPVAIKNILKALFLNTRAGFYDGKYLNKSEDLFKNLENLNSYEYVNEDFGLGSFVAAIINGAVTIEADLGKFIPGAPSSGNLLENVGSISVNILGMITTGTPLLDSSTWTVLGGAIKGFTSLIPAISDKDVDELGSILTNADPIKELWSKNALGTFLRVFASLEGDFSLKGILTSPLNGLFGLNQAGGLDLIDLDTGADMSIKDILKLLVDSMGADDVKLNFDNLAAVFKNIGDIIVDLPTSVEGISAKLSDPALEALFKIIADAKGLKGIMEKIQAMGKNQKTKITKDIKTAYEAIKTSAIVAISDTEYKATINSRIQIAFEIEAVNKSFVISKIVYN
ncbi:hypothetical protein SCLARK_001756 [Spiroplasma clarkii]|uniref:MOLPALP family lipoprotein n=1 Tax=Spiroplasma clarkii TaxID=2139 RepID=A0A1Y0L3E8_9MOLU|nr:lipoprotein [Spiroplasma clarkii]ARU92209.1 hypothetical protein SCLARK_001756 [Spiroplasma clarkii]ATX71531.1 hypothetical protein SCLAR_v1c12310 [Spiroplasma clarkii]